jgi:hypothetical protein
VHAKTKRSVFEVTFITQSVYLGLDWPECRTCVQFARLVPNAISTDQENSLRSLP